MYRYNTDMSHHFKMVSQMEVFHELHSESIKAGLLNKLNAVDPELESAWFQPLNL